MAKTAAETKKPRPRISVLERRLQNPFGEPSAPVEFVEAGWTGRWFNGDKGVDHVWRAKQKGWDDVRPDDLADIEQIGGYALTPGGTVARGQRQQEVLLKIRTEWLQKIQHAKEEENLRRLRPGAQKQELVNAAGANLGDGAAALMQKARIIGNVTTTREIVQRDNDSQE